MVKSKSTMIKFIRTMEYFCNFYITQRDHPYVLGSLINDPPTHGERDKSTALDLPS